MNVPPSPRADRPLDLLIAGVGEFNAGRFFDAHERFEALWKSPAARPEDRDFWKGLTQLAVGYCHRQRGNTVGAVSLLRRSTTYLSAYPSPYFGFDTATLIATALGTARRIEQDGVDPADEPPRLAWAFAQRLA